MKNRKALALGGLLMAVAVTAYSVSGTYAKYISTIGGTDKARVAQWSFNSGTQEIDLFKESYSTADNKTYVKSLGCTTTGEGENAVTTCDDVVAPGTNGQYTFQLNNNVADTITSEVNYKVTMKIGGINNAKVQIPTEQLGDYMLLAAADPTVISTTKTDDGTVTGYYYTPVKFAVVEGNTVGNDATWGTLEDAIKTIKSKYSMLTNKGTTTKNDDGSVETTTVVRGAEIADAMLNGTANKVYTIAWKWDYNDPSAADLDSQGIANAKLISKYDTKLGNKAMTEDTTVSVTIEFTLEQTQEEPTA